MQVEIAKTQLRAYGKSLVEVRNVIASYNVPAGQSTTIYLEGEPALVIEPDLST